VYLSGVPAHKKLLPSPCPQCGQLNGGVQFVFFNPRFYEQRTGYWRYGPYHLLRISHYSKEEYRINKHKPTKIWHNFQFLRDLNINLGIPPDVKVMSIDDLFNEADYLDKQSVTLQLTPKSAEVIRKYGWHYLMLMNEHAHWLNKTGPKKCPNCDRVVSELKKCFIYYEEKDRYMPYWYDYVWLCDKCAIDKENRRLTQKEILTVKSLSTS
jgi:hypothetical protein